MALEWVGTADKDQILRVIAFLDEGQGFLENKFLSH